MRLLLDTHTFLWAATLPGRLSAYATSVLADTDNDLYLSAVTCWEVAIKVRLGKLHIREELGAFVDRQVAAFGLMHLEITHHHAIATRELPLVHGDPFDRLLIAQAQVEGLTLVTNDSKIARYGTNVLW